MRPSLELEVVALVLPLALSRFGRRLAVLVGTSQPAPFSVKSRTHGKASRGKD